MMGLLGSLWKSSKKLVSMLKVSSYSVTSLSKRLVMQRSCLTCWVPKLPNNANTKWVVRFRKDEKPTRPSSSSTSTSFLLTWKLTVVDSSPHSVFFFSQYPYDTVREFIDFNHLSTTWGESGVAGFLNLVSGEAQRDSRDRVSSFDFEKSSLSSLKVNTDSIRNDLVPPLLSLHSLTIVPSVKSSFNPSWLNRDKNLHLDNSKVYSQFHSSSSLESLKLGHGLSYKDISNLVQRRTLQLHSQSLLVSTLPINQALSKLELLLVELRFQTTSLLWPIQDVQLISNGKLLEK